MMPCDALSERMPDVASGRAAWGAEEAAHLATCPACGDEWALVQAARTLGDSLPPPQAPEAMTAAVLARVADARRIEARQRVTRSMLQWGGLAAAAVLALAVLLRRPVPVTTPAPAPEAAVAVGASPLELPLPELDDAQPAELQAVLDGLATPLGETSTLDNDPGEDATPQDLERVLRAWEG